jgi:hypothetical protein
MPESWDSRRNRRIHQINIRRVSCGDYMAISALTRSKALNLSIWMSIKAAVERIGIITKEEIHMD